MKFEAFVTVFADKVISWHGDILTELCQGGEMYTEVGNIMAVTLLELVRDWGENPLCAPDFYAQSLSKLVHQPGAFKGKCILHCILMTCGL